MKTYIIALFFAITTHPTLPVFGAPIAELFKTPIPAKSIEISAKTIENYKRTRPELSEDALRIQLQGEKLSSIIFGGLSRNFIKMHNINATEEEIDEYIKATEKENDKKIGSTSGEGRADNQNETRKNIFRSMAQNQIITWKFNKALYEKYSGRVIWQQFNPMEPVDAYRKFLEEEEKNGNFKIDPKMTTSFWEYYRRQHPFTVPQGEIDFSKPWWLYESKEK